jgi:LPXTG-site transpeptidase (sortase) family protein
MSTEQHRRTGRIMTGAAVLLLVGGVAAVVLGLQPAATPSGPPPGSTGITAPVAIAPAMPARPTPSSPGPAATATGAPPAPPLVLARSVPTRIQIPAIGVDSSLMQLGLKQDGTLEVPPFDKHAPAGWYRGSPTPGELGPSVILGHVDTYKAGPVVFYRLSQVRAGNAVVVQRSDGRTARFVVDRVENVPKADFPRLEVYGNTDRPELRLITCGGEWNPRTHDYNDNTVVFAHLTAPKG